MSLNWTSLRQVVTTTGPLMFHCRRKGQKEEHSFSLLCVHPRESCTLILRRDYSLTESGRRQNLQGARDPSRDSRQ